MKRITGIVESISYSITNGIIVSMNGMRYNTYYIKPEQLKYGGINCEISTLVVGSKIEFDKEINEKTRTLKNVVILSDGIREVDADGKLIRW